MCCPCTDRAAAATLRRVQLFRNSAVCTNLKWLCHVCIIRSKPRPTTTQLRHNSLIKRWPHQVRLGRGFSTFSLNCLLNRVVFFCMVLFLRRWRHRDLRVVSSYFKAACWQHCQIRNSDRWCLSGYAFQTPQSPLQKRAESPSFICPMLVFIRCFFCWRGRKGKEPLLVKHASTQQHAGVFVIMTVFDAFM